MLYSQIPPSELDMWEDGDLSGAMWDEAIEMLGGYNYDASSIAELPLGYRAIMAEGSVRAHVENNGLVTTIWNDDGIEMFSLAADAYQRTGCDDAAELLTRIVELHKAWQLETGKTPRSFEWEDWKDLDHAKVLEEIDAEETLESAFLLMMRFLRNHPDSFK